MVKRNESAATILRDQGASPEDIRNLTAVLGARGRDGGLREGQKLRILFAPDAGRLRVVRVIVAGDAVEAVVALSDTGKYVAVDVQSMATATEVAEADEDDENDTAAVRLYQSIYETALRNQIPRPVIDDLVRIYSYDVDFQRRAQPGDSFEVLFSGEEEQGATNDVLFAALTVGGETKKFYRYLSPDDGVVDYYDETGKSAKKFLVRKPVGLGIMRSGFGFRRHPILGYSKMHTGVDWAAPYGTPIFSSGNGTVDRVGWEGGYGKYVRIRHNNGYETAYGHMSAFARGIEPGKRVRQGQVIGFVGSTGLSTGAHVHYEIVVNGRFVDPMRIRLPRGRVLEGPILAGFEKERDRVEGMMQRKAGVAGSGGARQDGGERRRDQLAPLRRLFRRRLAVEGEALLARRDRDLHDLAVLHLAGEDQLGERILHRLLDRALQRTRPIGRVVALVGEPVARRRIELDRDLAILQQLRRAAGTGCRRCGSSARA